jgi:hypothetical protein
MCKRLWFVNKIFLRKGMEFVVEYNEILISETQTNNSVVLKHKHKSWSTRVFIYGIPIFCSVKIYLYVLHITV